VSGEGLVHRLAALAAAPLDVGPDGPLARDVARRLRDTIGLQCAAAAVPEAIAVRSVIASWSCEESSLAARQSRPPGAGRQGAARLARPGAASLRAAHRPSHIDGRATVAGQPGRHAPAQAALLAGTLAHALDFDDTHLPSVLHPSSPVVAAALAVAQARHRSGPALVRAIAVGEEVCIRLGMAGFDPQRRSSVYFDRGLHATSICGTLGAAAAAAILIGLDVDGVANALAVAASMGAGIIEANRTGGGVKRIHCGWAAHAGVSAAELAAAGVTGPPTALEGRFGLLGALVGERRRDRELTDGLDELCRGDGRPAVLDVHFKPYPANHFTHAGIDAALALRAEGVAPEQIESVSLGVPEPVLRTIAEPADRKARPPDGYSAQFSGPFTFAVALVGGGGLGVYLDDFSDAAVRDPRLLSLAARVRCHADPECDRLFPVALPTIARVALRGGGRREIAVLANRGGPQRPLSDQELALKFELNAARSLDHVAVQRLSEALERLVECEDVASELQAV